MTTHAMLTPLRMHTIARATRCSSVTAGAARRGAGVVGVIGCAEANALSTKTKPKWAAHAASKSKLIRHSHRANRAATPQRPSAMMGNTNTKGKGRQPQQQSMGVGGAGSYNKSPIDLKINRKKRNRWARVSQLMQEEETREMWGAYRINTYATAERYSLSELAVGRAVQDESRCIAIESAPGCKP